jgi:hypothetical protein
MGIRLTTSAMRLLSALTLRNISKPKRHEISSTTAVSLTNHYLTCHRHLVRAKVSFSCYDGRRMDTYIEYIIRVVIRAANLIRSRRWPTLKATVVNADCPEPEHGCTVATLHYEYVVSGDKYGNTFEKPFIEPESGVSMRRYLIKG